MALDAVSVLSWCCLVLHGIPSSMTWCLILYSSLNNMQARFWRLAECTEIVPRWPILFISLESFRLKRAVSAFSENSEVGGLSCFIEFHAWFCLVSDRRTSDYATIVVSVVVSLFWTPFDPFRFQAQIAIVLQHQTIYHKKQVRTIIIENCEINKSNNTIQRYCCNSWRSPTCSSSSPSLPSWPPSGRLFNLTVKMGGKLLDLQTLIKMVTRLDTELWYWPVWLKIIITL